MHNQKSTVQLMDQIMTVVDDNKHPVFNFACGNKQSLDHDGIEKEVKQFYDKYYFIEDVRIISIGSKEKMHIDQVSQIFEEAAKTGTMSKKKEQNRPEREVRSPNLQQDLLMVTDSEKAAKIQIKLVVPFDKQTQQDSLMFLVHLLKRQLGSHLRQRLKVTIDEDMVFDPYDKFAMLHLDVDLNEKGRKHPAVALAGIIDCIRNLNVIATQENFETISEMKRAEYLVSSVDLEDYLITRTLDANYRKHGLNRLFSGPDTLTSYDPGEVEACLLNLFNAKLIVTLLGDFDHDMQAQNDFLDFFKGNPARDTQFGSRPQAASAVKLNAMTAHMPSYFAFFKFPHPFVDELLDRYARDPSSQEAKVQPFTPNRFVPTVEYLKSLAGYKPSMKSAAEPLETVKGEDRVLDAYVLPFVEVKALLNFDVAVDKNNYLQTVYYTELISMRLKSLNKDLESFKSSVSLTTFERGITLEVVALPTQVKEILKETISLMTAKSTTLEERIDAWHSLLNRKRESDYIYTQAVTHIGEFLSPFKFTLADLETFARQEFDQGFPTMASIGDLTISHLYVERSTDDVTAADLLPLFAGFRRAEVGFFKSEIRLPEVGSPMFLKNPIEGDIVATNMKGYLNCKYWGAFSVENMATLWLLERLMTNQVDDLLRRKKSLGYMGQLSDLTRDKQVFLCMLLQSELEADDLHREVESAWPELVEALRETNQESFETLKADVISENRLPFKIRSDSANFYFDSLVYGWSDTFYADLITKMASTTKDDLVRLMKTDRPQIISLVATASA